MGRADSFRRRCYANIKSSTTDRLHQEIGVVRSGIERDIALSDLQQFRCGFTQDRDALVVAQARRAEDVIHRLVLHG